MNRRLVTIVSVLVAGAATTFTVYLAADSGPVGTPRVAGCPVRVSDACRNIAADAGMDLHRYERVRFPVFRLALPDGGVEIDMPSALARLDRCVEVMDWGDCTLGTCASDPTICPLFDAGFPVRKAAQRKCLRAKFDAGLLCPLVDGGSFGDRNVNPRATRLDPAQCEEVECVILAGEDPETDL